MTIMFKCPGCGKVYQTADANAGLQNKCACGTVCLIPRAAATAVPPKAPAPVAAPPARPAPPAAPMARHAVPPPLPPGAMAPPMAAPPPMARPADFKAYSEAPSPVARPRKSNKKLFLAGGAALGLLVLVGLGWVLWKLLLSPASVTDDYKYVPSDCAVLVVVSMDQIMASDVYKKALEIPEVKKQVDKVSEEQAGMAPSNLLRFTVGVDPKHPEEYVVVARTKKGVTADDLKSGKKDQQNKKNLKYNEVKVGKYTVYEETYEYDFMPGKPQTGESFCLVDSKLILGGKTEGLRKVLERNKKPEFSDGMKNALKLADFSQPLAVAVNLKPVLSNKEIAGGLKFPALDKFVEAAEAFGLDVGLGSEIKVNTTLLCKDAKSAEDIKKTVEGLLVLAKNVPPQGAVPKEALDLLDAIKFSVDGSKVKASLSFNPDPFLKMAKEQMK